MPHARLEDRATRERSPERARREPAPAVAALLALQRGAGNRAVGRMLARRAAAPRQTGLRDDAAIGRFVRKAIVFREHNDTATLFHFANFLVAAANTELNRLGVPDMRREIEVNGPGGAHFDATTWTVVIHGFGRDTDEHTMIGDLDDNAAATLAMSVYHEARHAEQRFRVARMQAGAHEEPDDWMDESAVAAAAAQPLDKRRMPARELAEATEWRDSQSGEDALYREAVTGWQHPVADQARLARDVAETGADDPAAARDRIARNLQAWDHHGQMWVIRKHRDSALRRGKKPLLADIDRMIARFDAAVDLCRQLPASPAGVELAPLADALRELVRAIDAAYRNVPTEKDAYDAGYAAFDAFHAALGQAH